jgi:hypothetical protein
MVDDDAGRQRHGGEVALGGLLLTDQAEEEPQMQQDLRSVHQPEGPIPPEALTRITPDLGARNQELKADLGRPIAAPLERCAELLGVDPAAVHDAAAKVEPYIRADGVKVWSLMQLERQLRPEAFGWRRGAYIDRRRTSAADP